MNLFKRIRINVKKAKRVPPATISVREREFYICGECHNRYDAPHFFCPQCLGKVRSGTERLYALRLPAVDESRAPEISQLIEALSGRKDQGLKKALRRPSTLFDRSDPAVLQQWKEVFEAEKLEPSIEPVSTDDKRKKSTRRQPIFSAPASLPHFLTPATEEQVRAAGKSIQNAGIRMRWIELVLLASRIVEQCFKRKPTDRLIFSDYLFQIDQRLFETARDFLTYYKVREQEFTRVIEPLKSDLDRMEAEIDAVHRQVDEQL